MWIGRGRLTNDLARWREAGWVTPQGEREIFAELASRQRGPGLAGALGILGVVLLGFAAMSFVAANWQDMSRLTRLVIIFGAMLGSYAAAALLFERRLDVFAHAAVLLAVAVFGAGIMLIAQMYHIDGRPPAAVLTWALGAFAAGLLLRSNPSLVAAGLLFGLWSGWESTLASRAHLPFLLPLAALAAVFLAERWRPGLHVIAALATAWLVWFGYVEQDGHAHGVVMTAGLLAAGLCVAALETPLGARLGSSAGAASPLLGYAMVAAFAGSFALQFIESAPPFELATLAAVTLALLLAAVAFGLRTGQRHLVWLGYAGFSVEILALYFHTIGSLLGSSVFFLVAGLIVIALAGLAWRLHRAEERQIGAVP